MREYKTIFRGPGVDIAGRKVFVKSDWILVECYADDGELLLRGIAQDVPFMFCEAGFLRDTNTCHPNLVPIQTGANRQFVEELAPDYYTGIEVTGNVDSPIYDEIGVISGYMPE